MPKIKEATFSQFQDVMNAIENLRAARDRLKRADCPKSVDKVRVAVKSAEGALRHIEHRLRRTEDLT